MNTVNLVTIGALIVCAAIGFFCGFGRALKSFTGGIVGIIISIFVCATFGGMLLGTNLIGGWIADINAKLGEVAAFFEKIQVGVIIFYIVMFFVVQLLRIIVVKFVCGVFEADNSVMNVINKVLGTLFVPAVILCLTLLIFAVFRLFEDTAAITSLLEKIDGTILYKLYVANPITLAL